MIKIKEIRALCTINIEVTRECPLNCVQCYCTKEKKHIPIDIAKYKLEEASQRGAFLVTLSGGETLAYPHLCELISYIRELQMCSDISISGWNFDESVLNDLICSGIDIITVSLNGSTKDINSLTRDGYEYAVNALNILKENSLVDYDINWVAHGNNIDDFDNMLALAKEYGVKAINIIGLKPTSNSSLATYPSFEQIMKLGSRIVEYEKEKDEGDPVILVEPCFTELKNLLAIVNGSSNYAQCGACRQYYAITVDGDYIPCRHVYIPQKCSSLSEFWNDNELTQRLVSQQNAMSAKCRKCHLRDKCTPCSAITYSLENRLIKNSVLCHIDKFVFPQPKKL